jgi:hypothetical protein
MRTESVNPTPEENAFSQVVTDSPIGAGPKIGEWANVIISGIPSEPVSWLRRSVKIFGPGLVTGAADDDPSGIATYSSVGAQFGSSMLWTMPLIYPLTAEIQETSAPMGRVKFAALLSSLDVVPRHCRHSHEISLSENKAKHLRYERRSTNQGRPRESVV